jgi:aspartate carbamoyltransferase
MHLLSTNQFKDRNALDKLFIAANYMKHPHQMPVDLIYQARGKVMAIIKDEGSTRTRISFEVAMKRLGGEVVLLELDKTTSIAKGETLEDTVRTVSEYVDVIVLRHSQKGAVEKAAAVSLVPVINAGNGDGEHPTQALLDLYTIKKELGEIDGLKIMLVGDLKHSRTVHSLIHLLGFFDVKVQLVSPKRLELSAGYAAMLHNYTVWEDLCQAISKESPDVVYMTREQKERCDWKSGEYSWMNNFKVPTDYPVLTQEIMDLLPGSSIVMHPMPRCEELPVTLDGDSRCVQFRQSKNGMYIRMALLYNLFNNSNMFCNPQ